MSMYAKSVLVVTVLVWLPAFFARLLGYSAEAGLFGSISAVGFYLLMLIDEDKP